MNAIILSIGDELILGQTLDTNSAWLSQQLAAVGCDISAHMTIPDDQKLIERAIRECAGRCDFLIVTGGIGPTEDDLTRQALAKVMNVELEVNENWLHRLQAFFRARGREMPETNKIQAMIPHGATMIENTCGTAAGMRATMTIPIGEPASAGGAVCTIFVTPGVPKEMKAMFSLDILPEIQKSTSGAVILSRTLHTFGLGESWVAERLGELMKRDRNPSVGTTVSQGIVSLRINSRFESRDIAQERLDETISACRDSLGDIIYGEEDQSLSQVVGALLARSGKTVTTAESCTGGLLAKLITDIPGSSGYFRQGWITYGNEAKTKELHVAPALLEKYGAVSEAVVTEMAVGATDETNANYGLAISGVAGPDGGTREKPVGTVCIALAAFPGDLESGQVIARTFNFPGDREMIRDRSAKMALSMLRFHLLGKSLPF